MSFLDKFKNKGWGKTRAESDSPFDEMVAAPADCADEVVPDRGSGTLDMNAQASTATPDSSIISEAAPSEMAGEFGETRVARGRCGRRANVGSGLPLIGRQPVVQQQRMLAGMVALRRHRPGGVDLGRPRCRPSKGATQVRRTGQALMQSQRLAKSVSQALVGSPQAFPEVKESTEVLAAQRARPEERRRRPAPQRAGRGAARRSSR